MNTKSIILAFTISVLTIGCSSLPENKPNEEVYLSLPEYKEAFKKGIEEAKVEIKNGNLTIYYIGMSFATPKNGGLLNDETGLPYKVISGCVVTPRIIGRADGHNQTIIKYLDEIKP